MVEVRPKAYDSARLCTSISLQEGTTVWSVPLDTKNMQQTSGLQTQLNSEGSQTETEGLPTNTDPGSLRNNEGQIPR